MIAELADSIYDKNVRLIAQDGVIHFLAAGLHFQGPEPMSLFDEVLDSPLGKHIDPSHAFYLGLKCAKR